MAPMRPSMTDILKGGPAGRAGARHDSKMQRIRNLLQWRQAFMNEDNYPLKFDDGAVVNMQQISNGELKGLGTGAFVWPAAHVMAMYIEKRFRQSDALCGKRVIDLGSGTGATGFAAALCGADVTLTDQEQILFLTEKNMQRFCSEHPHVDASNICTRQYDWGKNAHELEPPFDIVLVSDCVLPKLYPIDILMEGVLAVMGPTSMALFSYEHRPYAPFDPRQEFERLAALHGLRVHVIPLTEHHPIYSAEDIELWEVTRMAPVALTQVSHGARPDVVAPVGSAASTTETTITGVAADISPNNKQTIEHIEGSDGLTFSSWGEVPCVQASMLGMRLGIKQRIGGGISDVLWPSSVIASRFILQHDYASCRRLLDMPCTHSVQELDKTLQEGVEIRNRPERILHALDLGAGCGLCSMALAMKGYDVTATDTASALGLLRDNLSAFGEGIRAMPPSQQEALDKAAGNAALRITVSELDWLSFAQQLRSTNAPNSGVERSAEASSGASDTTTTAANTRLVTANVGISVREVVPHPLSLIICSDCLYSTGAITPLLTVLEKFSGSDTIILLVNEMRSTFDEFLQAARRNWGASMLFKEVPITLPELEIMRGPTGRIASPPVRVCLLHFFKR